MAQRLVLHSVCLIACLLGLSACGTLGRDTRSGYADADYVDRPRISNFYEEKKQYEEQLAREDMGWAQSKVLNDDERQALEDHLKLRRMESKLETQREKRQYYQFKPLLRTDRERIALLSYPSVEARERWARNRGISLNNEKITEETAALIEKNDIAVGMNQKAVTESWGDPDLVEVAGDAVYGNERWKYSRYMSSNDGYQKENRVIFFESGRVVGWESY